MISCLCVMNSTFMNFLLWNYVFFMEIRLLMNFLFMKLCFMQICLRMTKQVFMTSFFKVSYQPSDLREVMFRPKGTHDGKYENMGDIRRSLPLIPLYLRALVRHRAHMNKFDKFSNNNCYEIFLWMCVMWFCLSYECVYFIQALLYLLGESSCCMFVLQATRVSSL